ncbi:MAG: GNAT family N-acetyltransferase [Bacteroidota bacterium]
MRVILQKVNESEKPILEGLLYTYFTELGDSAAIPDGSLDYPYLPSYWLDSNRTPLFILSEAQIAGSALLNDYIIIKAFNAQCAIAEFYIRPEFRRKGIGKSAAFQIFDRYGDSWEVKQLAENETSTLFWRSVISDYTKGEFEEVNLNNQIIQLFRKHV